ncbi:hypothetical protein [Vampirovibrio chlorellavorus]|uniref:hypothetical protein n=1 Tax=Vampirovibrio chlorellavorus TaxID=758823 RepID=UPI0026EB415D|nr:hypothetical protein [Vampirovibrio chlorellavorus]
MPRDPKTGQFVKKNDQSNAGADDAVTEAANPPKKRIGFYNVRHDEFVQQGIRLPFDS